MNCTGEREGAAICIHVYQQKMHFNLYIEMMLELKQHYSLNLELLLKA